MFSHASFFVVCKLTGFVFLPTFCETELQMEFVKGNHLKLQYFENVSVSRWSCFVLNLPVFTSNSTLLLICSETI